MRVTEKNKNNKTSSPFPPPPSQVPRFTVGGIPPGRVLVGTVWAYNTKGRGEPIALRLFTLKDQAEKRTGQSCEA